MPPKVSFTREDVLSAAFEILKEEGFQNITARQVSKKMNSSIAPLYSYYDSIEELKKEIKKIASEILFTYITKEYTENFIINIGLGTIKFAIEQRELYKLIFLEKDNFEDIVQDFFKFVNEKVKIDYKLKGLPLKDREEILDICWTYIYGYATAQAAGIRKNFNDKEFVKLMSDYIAMVTVYVLKKN